MASLIISIATFMLTMVNLYLEKRLMTMFRLTKEEGRKMSSMNQVINQKLLAIESLEKRLRANLTKSRRYDFWPSDD